MKKFNVLGRDIEFSDQMDNYNALKYKFEQLALTYCDEFEALYQQENTNLDKVVENAYLQGLMFISKGIDVALEELVGKYKVYSVDENLFYQKYLATYSVWEEKYSIIDDKYAEIVYDAKERDEYRIARRQARGRVVGGGFGVGGALKGMATAGAMNMATGAAHMVFNGFAKMTTSISNSMKKDKIFKNPDTLQTLKEGLYQDIANISLAIIDAVEDNGDGYYFDYVTTDEAKEAEIIFNNLSKGRIPESEVASLIQKIFTLNPYKRKYYEHVLLQYGDVNGGLGAMSRYFHINLDSYKKDILKESFVPLENLDSLDKIDEFLSKIQQLASSLQYQNLNQLIEPYIVRRKQLDEMDRLVDGILFNTKQEADVAKDELQRIQSVYDSTKQLAEADAIHALENLAGQQWQTALVDKHKEKLKAIIEQHDIEARTVNGTMYQTREEATAIREAEAIIQTLKQRADLSTIEGIDSSIQDAQTVQLPTEIARQAYIHSLEEAKKALMQKLLTFKGKQYATIDLVNEAKAMYYSQVKKELGKIEEVLASKSKKKIKKQLSDLSISEFETVEAIEKLEETKAQYMKSVDTPTSSSSQEEKVALAPRKKSRKKVMVTVLGVLAALLIGLAVLGSMIDVDETSKASDNETTAQSKSEETTDSTTGVGLDAVPFEDANDTKLSGRDQIEQLLSNYLVAYTSNDISDLSSYVDGNSDFYASQTDYMSSLYNRGITVTLDDFAVLQMKQTSDDMFSVKVEEKYTIDNPQSGTKTLSQIGTYTVELVDGEFYIFHLQLN